MLIHGSGGTSYAWTRQYSKLHNSFNILAVNLPGDGKSEGVGEQSVDAYVAHLRDIIGAAGLARPLLVGHSLGAAIALAFALHHPDETSGVVAVGGRSGSGSKPCASEPGTRTTNTRSGSRCRITSHDCVATPRCSTVPMPPSVILSLVATNPSRPSAELGIGVA